MRFKGSSLLVGVIGFASFRRRRPPGLRENGVLGSCSSLNVDPFWKMCGDCNSGFMFEWLDAWLCGWFAKVCCG